MCVDLPSHQLPGSDWGTHPRRKLTYTAQKGRVSSRFHVEMKIDTKAVTYFESCNSPVDKEGYLYKKGEIKTSYQKRWFVLKGNLLFYKDAATDRDPIGVIVLEGCTVQLCESDEQFAFSLVWSEPGLRTYKFAAEDQANLESWIKALLSANHSYLALLVMDMEKKYRDALSFSSNEPTNSFTMPNFKNPSEMENPAARLSTQTSASTFYVAPDFAAGPGGSSSQMLQALALSSRSTSKRSPKLWPKRNANAAGANTFAPPLGEGLGIFSVTKEEFIKLHDDFGKEVKKLIADWSKRGQDGNTVQEENLIDFS